MLHKQSTQNTRREGWKLWRLGCFLILCTKNITCGEGGMITADNKGYADNVKLLRQHGRSNMSSYEYSNLGYNYRMTDINAAILLEQLKKADLITRKRIENAQYLSEGLADVKGIESLPLKRS